MATSSPSLVAGMPRRGVTNRVSHVVQFIPALLALVLLAWQVSLPWQNEYFVMQDAPSHLYNAKVARALWAHAEPYTSLYRFHPHPIPNWTTTLLFVAADAVVGTHRAEQLVASLLVLSGLLCFLYAARVMAPFARACVPLAVFLFQTWFFVMGFTNFYLGMAFCLVIIGYYLRHAARLTGREAALLAVGLLALYFTHLVAAALAMMALGLIALWVHVAGPMLSGGQQSWRGLTARAWHPCGRLALSMMPVLALMAGYLLETRSSEFNPDFQLAWRAFPMHVFHYSSTRWGRQELLYAGVLCYLFLALGAMTRREWTTARGGLWVSAVMALVLYACLPNLGFGGGEVKVRFSWAFYLFAGLLATSLVRLRPLHLPLSLYVAFWSAAALSAGQDLNAKISRSAQVYETALRDLPRGSTFVRMRFDTKAARDQFALHEIPFDSFFHLDASIAARHGLVDLSDYEANSNVFPVVYQERVPGEAKGSMWGMEDSANLGRKKLEMALQYLPVRVDYIVVLSDPPKPTDTELIALLAEFDSKMRLVSSAGDPTFVRVYQNLAAR